MGLVQELILTFGAPVGMALTTMVSANLFQLPVIYLLILICVPTAAISVLVMMRLRRKFGSSSGKEMRGPKIALNVKPTAAQSTTASKNSLSAKAALAKPATSTTPLPAVTPASTAKTEVKPEQLVEIKEIRDLLSKMQSQMELISEILLSSPDEKNEIRERSSALKKFKLNGAVEVKPASSQSPTNPKEAQDSKEPGTPSAQPKKPEDQPFVSKKGLFEEIPKPNTTPMSKPSALIKIPVSAIQQGADEVPQDSQKWRETPTTNSSGKGITELVQLRKELERIRERIASPAT